MKDDGEDNKLVDGEILANRQKAPSIWRRWQT